MKKRSAPLRDKELERLRALVGVREKQFQAACRGLKKIIEFESAHLSVFETEVHRLQADALDTLVTMENVQRPGKRGLLLTPAMRRKLPKVPEVLWQPLYDSTPARQRIRLEDEDV